MLRYVVRCEEDELFVLECPYQEFYKFSQGEFERRVGDVLVDQGNGGFEDQGEFVLKDAVPGVEQEQRLNHEKATYDISRIIRQISTSHLCSFM